MRAVEDPLLLIFDRCWIMKKDGSVVVHALADCFGREDFHAVAVDFLLVLTAPFLDHVVLCGVEP